MRHIFRVSLPMLPPFSFLFMRVLLRVSLTGLLKRHSFVFFRFFSFLFVSFRFFSFLFVSFRFFSFLFVSFRFFSFLFVSFRFFSFLFVSFPHPQKNPHQKKRKGGQRTGHYKPPSHRTATTKSIE